MGEATEALSRLSGDLGEAGEQLRQAKQGVADLEERVGHGDSTVSALELLEARHAVELGARKVEGLEVLAREAQGALTQSKAHATVDEWEAQAPELRAKIRAATRRLLEARDEILAEVEAYNTETRRVKLALRGVPDDGGRFSVRTFGAVHAGTESLRELLADGIIGASFIRTPGDQRAALQELGDVLPYSPEP